MNRLDTVIDSRTGNEATLPDAIKTSQPLSGWLFTPKNDTLPAINPEEISQMADMDYQTLALNILSRFDLWISQEELKEAIGQAYGDQWYSKDITPVTPLWKGTNLHSLHLGMWPTFAFKNVALELVPRIIGKLSKGKQLTAIGASSGDTINAAHFWVDGTNIDSVFLLPYEGPSEVQTLQATSSRIKNAITILIKWDFDTAQAHIKTFNGPEYADFKEKHNTLSFNSIQILRIISQIVYYFRAYSQLIQQGVIQNGDPIDFSVPSGNFGDALAGFYAREMGLPIRKINIATNENDILHRFLKTGIYEPVRKEDGTRADAVKTMAPSQDITVSSNFERVLFWACNDAGKIQKWMDDLKKTGKFEADTETLTKLKTVFTSSSTNDEWIRAMQIQVWKEHGKIIDPHTATGVFPYAVRKPDVPTVFLETAHPIQFPASKYLQGSGVPDFESWAKEHGNDNDQAMVEYVNSLRAYTPVEGEDYLVSWPTEAEVFATIQKALTILEARKKAA